MTDNLEATGVKYFSRLDETAFFGWLQSIPCVGNVRGGGRTLLIELKSDVDDESLRELVAIFRRYGVDMRQLARFRHASNESWFARPESAWFSAVFDAADEPAKLKR